MNKQGAIWGACADIINRASWAICQVTEAVAENCWHAGTLEVKVSFVEFNLDVSMSYQGELPDFPQARRSEDEIITSDDGVRRLAGYMLRNSSDKSRLEMKNGNPLLTFHFDHCTASLSVVSDAGDKLAVFNRLAICAAAVCGARPNSIGKTT